MSGLPSETIRMAALAMDREDSRLARQEAQERANRLDEMTGRRDALLRSGAALLTPYDVLMRAAALGDLEDAREERRRAREMEERAELADTRRQALLVEQARARRAENGLTRANQAHGAYRRRYGR
jgi:hypothetical protein